MGVAQCRSAPRPPRVRPRVPLEVRLCHVTELIAHGAQALFEIVTPRLDDELLLGLLEVLGENAEAQALRVFPILHLPPQLPRLLLTQPLAVQHLFLGALRACSLRGELKTQLVHHRRGARSRRIKAIVRLRQILNLLHQRQELLLRVVPRLLKGHAHPVRHRVRLGQVLAVSLAQRRHCAILLLALSDQLINLTAEL